MAERRIKINLDNTPIVQLNAQLKELADRYKNLAVQNKDLSKLVADGAKDQTKALDENNKALEQTKKEITDISKATGTLNEQKPFDQMANSTKPLTQQLRGLRMELIRMVDAGENNTAEFAELAKKTGALKVSVMEAGMELRQFEAIGASATDAVGVGFANVKSQLGSLDFKNASRGLAGVNESLKAIDVKQMSKDIIGFSKALGGTLVQSVKTMGKTFMAVGKALLTNPLFLIAAIVAGVVIAIIKLSDKVELFGKIVKLATLPLTIMLELLSKLGDWLGLTNNAEQDLANKRAKRFQDESDRVNKENTLKQRQFDRDIKLLQAKGDLTQEEKQQIQDLTQAKLSAEIEKANAEKKAIENQIKALRVKGNLTDEEITKIKELRATYADLGETVKDAQADIIANGIKYNVEIQKQTDDADKAILDKQKASWDKRKAELEKRKQEEAKLRAEAVKFIADVEEKTRLSAIEDTEMRALETTLTALRKEREEILKNVQLTEQERFRIKEYYQALEVTANNEYDATKLKQEQDFNAKSKDLTDKFEVDKMNAHLEQLKLNSTTDLTAGLEYQKALHKAKLDDLGKQYEETRALYEEQGLDTQDLENFFLDQRLEADKLYYAQLDDLAKQAKEKDLKDQQELIAKKLENAGNYASSVNNLTNAVFDISNSLGKQDEKNTEARAKRQFAVQKALSLSMAIIDGFKAVTSSLASSPIAIGPIPNPAGIASLAFAVTTSLANIAKISATKYKSSGSGPSTPSIPGASAPIDNNNVSLGANSTGQTNQIGAPTSTGSNTPPIMVKVSISEVEEVSSRVGRYQSASEL